MGVDEVFALDVLLERRERVAVFVLALVGELDVGGPVGRTTYVFSAHNLRVVAGQILGDPLLRTRRPADASPSADLHKSLCISGLALADTFADRAALDRLDLRENEVFAFRDRLRRLNLDGLGSGGRRKLLLYQSFLFVGLSSRHDCLCDNRCSCKELQTLLKHLIIKGRSMG